MTKKERVCSVYLRSQDVFVISVAKTVPGFEILQKPVIRLVTDKSDTAIGQAVLQALQDYRENVQPPDPNAQKSDAVLEALGFNSWGQLERSGQNVLIVEKVGLITATPTRRQASGGFLHLNELAVQCQPVAEKIGAAVRKAEALCS